MHPWTTICELVDDAARRFPDLEALVDGDVRWTFPELRDRVRGSARASDGLGHRAGRSGGGLGAQYLGMGGGRARGFIWPGACWCRSTPGSRAARPISSSRSPALAFCSPSPTSWTPTTWPCFETPTAASSLDEIVVLRGSVPEGTTGFAGFPRAGRAGVPRPTATPGPPR